MVQTIKEVRRVLARVEGVEIYISATKKCPCNEVDLINVKMAIESLGGDFLDFVPCNGARMVIHIDRNEWASVRVYPDECKITCISRTSLPVYPGDYLSVRGKVKRV